MDNGSRDKIKAEERGMPMTPIHLLMMAVLQEQDVEMATRALEGLGASVVYMASTGGFLGRKNATLLPRLRWR